VNGSQARVQRRFTAIAFVVVAACVVFAWVAYDSFVKSVAASDARSCEKNLAFYESYCLAYPDHCAEGARKLAGCNP
jgi:hypothetical protein